MDAIGERRLRRHRSAAISCYSPRRIVDWLLAALRPAKARRIREETQNETVSLSTSRSMSGLNGHEESASENELAKMVELREEMEILFQNVREELRRKDALVKPLKPSDTLASSITNTRKVCSSNSHLSAQSQKPYVQPESESKMVHNHFLQCIITEQDECVEKINELEVELERLQLHLDRETALQHTQEARIKVTIEDSPPSSDGMSFDEIIDPQDTSTELCIGVPPYELERRLYELFEARQQERIEELESALECARQKLIQKEEVTWWKDTAGLISVHSPETSRFIFQIDSETDLKLK